MGEQLTTAVRGTPHAFNWHDICVSECMGKVSIESGSKLSVSVCVRRCVGAAAAFACVPVLFMLNYIFFASLFI